MEELMHNPNLVHIHEIIFGFLSHETVEICREVSEYWKKSLERISQVNFLQEFGQRNIDDFPMVKVLTIIPGLPKAVKKFGAQATIEDLRNVKEAVAKLVGEDGKCCPNPVHQAAENGDLKLIELFLNTSYDMNTGDGHGRTALHWACFNGRTEVVQLFIQSSKEYGIDLNARDVAGWTPFHWACFGGSTETVRLLMKNRKEFAIDIKDAQNNAGETALDYIEERLEWDPNNDKFIECFEILCQEM